MPETKPEGPRRTAPRPKSMRCMASSRKCRLTPWPSIRARHAHEGGAARNQLAESRAVSQYLLFPVQGTAPSPIWLAWHLRWRSPGRGARRRQRWERRGRSHPRYQNFAKPYLRTGVWGARRLGLMGPPARRQRYTAPKQYDEAMPIPCLPPTTNSQAMFEHLCARTSEPGEMDAADAETAAMRRGQLDIAPLFVPAGHQHLAGTDRQCAHPGSTDFAAALASAAGFFASCWPGTEARGRRTGVQLRRSAPGRGCAHAGQVRRSQVLSLMDSQELCAAARELIGRADISRPPHICSMMSQSESRCIYLLYEHCEHPYRQVRGAVARAKGGETIGTALAPSRAA